MSFFPPRAFRFSSLALLSLMLMPVQAQEASAQAAPASLESTFQDLDYRYVGPSRGGRVTAVAGHRAHPHTFYMGSTGGGVWKTSDAGQTWTNISDGFFETASIGSIDVADSNPDIIYVGTGSDGLRSNVIIGRGLYKSTDAGKTWTHMGLRKTGQIGAVVVHPTNPDIVWVAAQGSPFGPNPDRGVYKSVDGGTTWQHVLHVSDRTGAIDLELNPANSDEVYAALWHAERKPWTIISGDDGSENGIYVSHDAGATWTRSMKGLPTDLIGKIDFAVTPADASRIYALVEARPEVEGLYRSNDHGESWQLVSNEGFLMTRPFYYTNVDADPVDADRVYVNNLGFHRSDDGGKTWVRISTPHGDNHDMWINPDDTDLYIQANDGGVNVTLDGGRTWSPQDNQATAELYSADVDDRFPYWIYSGQQDNSTIRVPSNPAGSRAGGYQAYWEAVGGCETGPVVPKPGDPDIVYANCKGQFGVYNDRTGQERSYYVGAWNLYSRNPAELPYRFQRVVPIEVSPHDPETVYHGSQYVHRTRNAGQDWETISPDLTAFRPERQMVSGGPITRDGTGEEHYSTLYVIEESPLEPGVIWTGANDGPVHVTRDGGATWVDVTPGDMPPEGRINSLDPSPHTPGVAYLAAYRYLLNDFTPYFYRTADYGKTWTRIATGIPADHPARILRVDPEVPGLLYAGTDYGVWVSMDDGASWQTFQFDLPVTPITDMRLVHGDLVLSTMGRGFWVMDDLSPVREWAGAHRTARLQMDAFQAEPHLFAPAPAVRGRWGARGGRPEEPEYAPPGARIDYRLPEGFTGRVTLEVHDAAGTLVGSFEGEAAAPASEEQGMRQPPRPAPRGSDLDTTPGVHRFVWDMRHEGPDYGNGRTGRGPMAVPGDYTLTLRAGAVERTQVLTIVPDPRLEGVSQADMEVQLAFNQKMVTLISEAYALQDRVEKALEALPEGADARKELTAIAEALENSDTDSYATPMMLNQMGYLYGMTSGADQHPGGEAEKRYMELKSELQDLQARFEAVAK
ncbi:MAG: glycosyl hydrolase [Rhodothermales bacterium]